MDTDKRERAQKIMSVSAIVVSLLGLVVSRAERLLVPLLSEGVYDLSLYGSLIAIPALVVAAVFASAWLNGKLLWLPVVLTLPGLIIIAPWVAAAGAAILLSAATAAFFAGRELGQPSADNAHSLAAIVLASPVVVVTGFTIAVYGLGNSYADDWEAVFIHYAPLVVLGLLVVLSALASGVRGKIPIPALVALAFSVGGHLSLLVDRMFIDELVILALACFAYAAGFKVAKRATRPRESVVGVTS